MGDLEQPRKGCVLPRGAQMRILFLIAFVAGVSAAPPGTGPIDYRQCSSSNDHGWPRFENRSQLEASPWSSYLQQKYGQLPFEYPFCTFDLWYIDPYMPAYKALGLKPDPTKASTVNRINHTFHAGDYNDGDFFQTSFGMWIYHGEVTNRGTVANNTWIEVQHALFPTENSAMWFTRSRGSGIWYNVGRTITFVSDGGHNAAYNYFADRGCEYPPPPHIPDPSKLNCSDPKQVQYCLEIAAAKENAMARCAAKAGFESVQFKSEPGPIIETFGRVGWLELLSTSLNGSYACGTPEGGTTAGFRFGWNASAPCKCQETHVPYSPTNCRGNFQ